MALTMTEKQTDQLCTFRLGNLFLGIDVLDVREVLQTAEITAVPHADGAVEGLINLRGQIATAINLRRRLEVGDDLDDESHQDDSTDSAYSAEADSERNDDEGQRADKQDLDGEMQASSIGPLETDKQPTQSAETLAMEQEMADRANRSLHVVIISGEEPVTLMVDAIGDVVDVDRTTYEVPPPTLSGAARRFIRGAYKLDEELLLLLDLQRLVALEQPETPDAA